MAIEKLQAIHNEEEEKSATVVMTPMQGSNLPPSDAVLIVNPRAGSRRSNSVSGYVEQLQRAGISLASVFAEARNPTAAAQAALARNVATIIAAGGDGTVSAVSSALIGSGVKLGILPVGTRNHFARDLGIPPSVPAAASIIAAGRVRLVDVGEVNGRTFLNNSGLGLYPRIVLTRERRRRLGVNRWLALLAAVIRTLRSLPILELRVVAGDTELERQSAVVLVANNEYIVEGLRAGIRNSLEAGRLYVYVATAQTSSGLIRLSLRALLKRLHGIPEFETISATQVRIETRRRYVVVSHDGEFTRMSTPLEFRIRPAALHVLAP